MTTAAWSDTYSHADNAGFQYWATDISTRLQTAGLVQTADTGQVDTATMTKPGTVNTYAGYEIFYLNDALHATKPIYIKIEYGTGNIASRPGLRFACGTGTDGAGNLTNASTALLAHNAHAPGDMGTWQNYICVTEGVVWLIGNAPTINTVQSGMFLLIARGVDGTGAIDGLGAYVYGQGASNQFSVAGHSTHWRSQGDVQFEYYISTQNRICQTIPVKGNGSNLADDFNGDTVMVAPQLWCSAYRALNALFMANPIGSAYVSFAATLIGATPHTYLPVRQPVSYPGLDQGGGNLNNVWLYLIWE